jgi:hypothetical protein
VKTYNGRYLAAEQDGGGVVSTDRTAVGPWEKFSLYSDSFFGWTPGTVTSCDPVYIAHEREDGTRTWVGTAVNGGGSVFRIDRGTKDFDPGSHERFYIYKVGADCGTPIQSGDRVNFQSYYSWKYMCAEQGGGIVGDGSINVDRDWAREWETFTLEFQ